MRAGDRRRDHRRTPVPALGELGVDRLGLVPVAAQQQHAGPGAREQRGVRAGGQGVVEGGAQLGSQPQGGLLEVVAQQAGQPLNPKR